MKITHMKTIGLSAILALLVCSFGVYAEETKEETHMNKDQVKGRVEESKGKVKEVTGKILNDDEMELEGNVEKKIGKVKAGFGDLKDDIKKSK